MVASVCMLGFPNKVDAGSLSGGSWVATLPLSNLQDRDQDATARSTNLLLASTQFQLDLGSIQKIQAICVRNHNFSSGAKYRIRAGSTASVAASTVYDSGWTDTWPVVYPEGVLEWEDENWWSGKYTAEEMTGYTTELDLLMETFIYARYWLFEFDDQVNPDGFLDLGRVFIGPLWQPAVNMTTGATIAWETGTEVREALSGAETFQEYTPFRVARFALDFMEQDEAFSRAFELQRQAGISKEVLFIHSPNDTVHALRRRFLGRLRSLSPIEYPTADLHKTAFEIKELK